MYGQKLSKDASDAIDANDDGLCSRAAVMLCSP